MTTPSSANYPTDSAALTNTTALESSFDYKTYYHELLALGLSHTPSKKLLIKELEDNQGSVISEKSDLYWKATNESTSAIIRQRLVNQQAASLVTPPEQITMHAAIFGFHDLMTAKIRWVQWELMLSTTLIFWAALPMNAPYYLPVIMDNQSP